MRAERTGIITPFFRVYVRACVHICVLGLLSFAMATHGCPRYNAVRMEPTWMILGHAAGAAAALAVAAGTPVQAVNVTALQALLLQQQKQLAQGLLPPSDM